MKNKFDDWVVDEEGRMKVVAISKYEELVRDLVRTLPSDVALNAVANAFLKMSVKSGVPKKSFISQLSNGWDYFKEDE
jgi:hypothetical protein